MNTIIKRYAAKKQRGPMGLTTSNGATTTGTQYNGSSILNLVPLSIQIKGKTNIVII